MRKGIVLIGILLFVLIGTASVKALPVDDDTEFMRVQGGVASNSDTIIMHTETYTENVDLNKQLPLQSKHDIIQTIVQSVLIIILMMLSLRIMVMLYHQVFSQ